MLKEQHRMKVSQNRVLRTIFERDRRLEKMGY
jgi:hypothetical protein